MCRARVSCARDTHHHGSHFARFQTASAPVPVRSQILIVLSRLPVTAVRPSGAIATDSTESVCPSRVRTAWPLDRSQSLAVLSMPPDSAVRLLDDTATAKTFPACPGKRRSSRPDESSHNLTVASSPPESTCCPSEVTATALMSPSWPLNSWILVPSATFHVCSTSLAADTATSPFGATATERTLESYGKVRMTCAFERSQSFSVVSRLADNARRPPGKTATDQIASWCPSKLRIGRVILRSHSLSVA